MEAMTPSSAKRPIVFAVAGHRADRAFDIALEGFLGDARRRLADA
jgi:hypothetical protein